VLEAFAERVKRVASVLNSPELGYLLVVAPDRRSLDEGERVLARLKAEGRTAPTVLVNRVHQPRFAPGELDRLPTDFASQVEACPSARLESAWVRQRVSRLVPELVHAHEAAARREDELLRSREATLGPMLRVKELDRDVDDLEGLWRFSRLLATSGQTQA
jgi:anion-transporting  ArsA/GET3 family ATPase